MKHVTIPNLPNQGHNVLGAISLYASTASFCVLLPITNSANNSGKPINNVKPMKIRKNAPPPPMPAIYGNFQIAPRPIAEPAAANTKPNFDVHCCEFIC
ncbi:Uncharacterised protein [Streptococcus pneumoniae]|nr:Uncharacterised protein [Streptococcus pneumoniae]CJC74325.1 Uncharacterised protein [Streptococcus pneumoniae]CKE98470.1 Uncharacterised protein [Streptococcus pneumoniae]